MLRQTLDRRQFPTSQAFVDENRIANRNNPAWMEYVTVGETLYRVGSFRLESQDHDKCSITFDNLEEMRQFLLRYDSLSPEVRAELERLRDRPSFGDHFTLDTDE